MRERPPSGRRVRRRAWLGAGAALSIAGAAVYLATTGFAPATPAPVPKMRLGLNLLGMQTFNRQPVFANLIAQSEWFTAGGDGWAAMPETRLDRHGWVLRLRTGETAPRPLSLPPAGSGAVRVRCSFAGNGVLSAGGIATDAAQEAQGLSFTLAPTGAADEGAWITLERTDPLDPVRDIDCRDTRLPRSARFHPDLLALLQGFDTLRFMDWQRVNDNPAADWADRATPAHGSQVTPRGVSIEDMVALANLTGADPWFTLPYRADAAYTRAFARLVHARIDPARTVHVELGNEIWNDMFDAAQQAGREAAALGLADDPAKARMRRYAQKSRDALRIWTEVFADRPERLVRIVSTQNAWPDLSRWVLDHDDTAGFVDALATAPYLWIDLAKIADPDAAFAAMPAAIDEAMAGARANRDIARRHGKRFIAYEGGQHLVTPDVPLAIRIQRDPRMGTSYRRYLQRWQSELGDQMMLYASTGAIGDYGAWGLREHAGQPESQTPKLTAVRAFLKHAR